MRHVGLVLVVVAAGCSSAIEDDSTSGTGTTTGSAEDTASPTTGVITTVSTVTGPVDTGEAEVDSGDPSGVPDFWDGGEAESGECFYWATLGCAVLDEPNAFGSVVTPLGELDVLYAYFASQTYCGGCVDPNLAGIFLLTAPAENIGAGPPDNSLWVQLESGEAWMGPTGTPQPATNLVAYQNGTAAEISGASFVLDDIPSVEQLAEPFDPSSAAIVGGTIDLTADGWSVHLSFDARYCPDANSFAICE